MMYHLIAQAGLFASGSGWLRALGGRVGMVHACIIATSAALLWGGLMIVDSIRVRRSERRQSPEGLFFELCAAHRLDRTERNTLWNVAETLPPAECCRIFLDPDLLDRRADSGDPEAPDYARLGAKLFGPRG